MDQNHELQSHPFLLANAYVHYPPMIHPDDYFKVFILLRVQLRIKEVQLNQFGSIGQLKNLIIIMKLDNY
jgi:hypothetical protein